MKKMKILASEITLAKSKVGHQLSHIQIYANLIYLLLPLNKKRPSNTGTPSNTTDSPDFHTGGNFFYICSLLFQIIFTCLSFLTGFNENLRIKKKTL